MSEYTYYMDKAKAKDKDKDNDTQLTQLLYFTLLFSSLLFVV